MFFFFPLDLHVVIPDEILQEAQPKETVTHSNHKHLLIISSLPHKTRRALLLFGSLALRLGWRLYKDFTCTSVSLMFSATSRDVAIFFFLALVLRVVYDSQVLEYL